ncbi:biotin-dependent carboxyltransferase family protein [Colwellia sp. UCD-KL20]|uniref:5-oxoprolinase subunit C family protein n=1 Tax=Colwellia sp. UCD-KL20 TaxID=1917165 RepID=UPI0009708F6C|nr:biotin-dependent carboxyltransferase family protein [Colwellia sp. UCD-KL20]
MGKCVKHNADNYLTVIKKNGLCSIQDLGRLSSQHLGFSAGGAADEYAFLFANYLLGNNQNSAQLEITLGQITFKAAQDCTMAITGADCSVYINDNPIKNWQAHQVSANDIIHFGQPKAGLHTYLAITDGIQSKQWLNSQSQTSTENRLSFGATPIIEGSIIKLSNTCFASNQHTANINYKRQITPSLFYNNIQERLILRFIPQPLFLGLSSKEQDLLCAHLFTISSDSNRMGYRLSTLPEKIITTITNLPKPTLSKPVTFGAIQLPSNNQPIVLMKERQTIGGYPVLGGIIQSDLCKLSQLRPGNKVQFTPTTLNFAQQQLSALYQKFN